jgi:predicted phosphodiesterase
MKISKYEDFIPQNVAISGAVNIGVYKKSGKRVGEFGLQNLRIPIVGEKLYSFGAISDVHIQRPAAKDDFQRALSYFNSNNDILFVCVCGDLTEGGYAEQLAEYKVCVDSYAEKPVYAISGNHETYGGLDIANVIETYTGQPLYYSFTQGNDVFIMLGIKSEDTLFTDDEIQWLYDTLEANRNKRCFVFQHIFAGKEKEAVCGNPYGLYHNYCWSNETQTAIFESLMEHYTNAIFFHGHSHFRFNSQSKNCTYANIDKSNGYWSVHIPSIAVPREDADGDGTTEYYTAGSEGYVVDVYENHIVLRGRDFVNEKFLPIAQYCIDTTVQEIETGTFTDSTGTINTGK